MASEKVNQPTKRGKGEPKKDPQHDTLQNHGSKEELDSAANNPKDNLQMTKRGIGRPKKDPQPDDLQNRENEGELGSADNNPKDNLQMTKRGRGRPKKDPQPDDLQNRENEGELDSAANNPKDNLQMTKRGRGRPKKDPQPDDLQNRENEGELDSAANNSKDNLQMTKRGRGRPKKDPQPDDLQNRENEGELDSAVNNPKDDLQMTKRGRGMPKKHSPSEVSSQQSRNETSALESFFNMKPSEMKEVKELVESWKSDIPLHKAFTESVMLCIETLRNKSEDDCFHYKYYGSLLTCSYSPLKLPDLDMAFVLNFAHGEYADVLAIHLVDNGFVCAKVQNRDDISNYQSKLAQFLGRKTRNAKNKDECNIFKETDGKLWLNPASLRIMLQEWKDRFGLIDAKVPSSGASLSFSFDANVRPDRKISSAEKFLKDMSFKDIFTKSLQKDFCKCGLPLWQLHKDLFIDVDLSILVKVPFSRIPPEWQKWTTRTPPKCWPPKSLIDKLKAAHVLLSPRCSPKDGKMDRDFCPTFEQDILLKSIPNGISTLSLLKSLLISFAQTSKDRPKVKSNSLIQTIFWVHECHSCGRDLMDVFQKPIPRGTNKVPPKEDLPKEVMLLRCLSLLKESYKHENGLPNFFNPKINVLDFDVDTDTIIQLVSKNVLKAQLNKIVTAKQQTSYHILTIAKILYMTLKYEKLPDLKTPSPEMVDAFVKKHQPKWIAIEEARLDSGNSDQPDQSDQLLVFVKSIKPTCIFNM